MKDRSICGARSRRTGEPCRNAPMTNGRCRLHGGMSAPAGPTHHSYRHGRYSKALDRTDLAELYETARTDPHLLALRDEIAVLVAKQQETVSRFGTGVSLELLEQLKALTEQAQNAMTRGDDADLEGTMAAMEVLLNGGAGDHHVWAEYTQRAEQIRKLVDTERKYEEALRLYLPLNRANAIMGMWLHCLKRAVPQEYLTNLYDELRKARSRMPSLSPTEYMH